VDPASRKIIIGHKHQAQTSRQQQNEGQGEPSEPRTNTGEKPRIATAKANAAGDRAIAVCNPGKACETSYASDSPVHEGWRQPYPNDQANDSERIRQSIWQPEMLNIQNKQSQQDPAENGASQAFRSGPDHKGDDTNGNSGADNRKIWSHRNILTRLKANDPQTKRPTGVHH
jgi:hypothetical protein